MQKESEKELTLEELQRVWDSRKKCIKRDEMKRKAISAWNPKKKRRCKKNDQKTEK